MWQRLPAELIIEVLKYCTGSDVLNFGIATGSDQIIISSKKIWKTVTITHPSDFSRCQSYLGDHTKILRIIGPSISSLSQFKSEFYISELLLNSIREHCPMLEDMTIEFCVVDSSDIKFSMFPKTIKILRLKKIAMKNIKRNCEQKKCPYQIVLWPQTMDVSSSAPVEQELLGYHMACCACYMTQST